jgi:ThiF family/Prokaryotic homologs of the JAB domain
MQYQIRIAGKFYQQLVEHLFPADGKEAVAFLLCGRHKTDEISILLSHQLLLMPYEECIRTENRITWRTERIIPLLEAVEKRNFAILKIHSHPGGYDQFSATDDQSDEAFFKTVFNWSETEDVHGSVVFLPDGQILARYFGPELKANSFDRISVTGDEIKVLTSRQRSLDDFAQRTIQAFGDKTYEMLKDLKVGVVGCSGTGSITIEQLCRLGIGSFVIADPKKVEVRNLNRIPNSKRSDAKAGRYKVDILKSAIEAAGLGNGVKAYPVNLFESKDLLLDLITCDVIFGCMDSAEGRHLLNLLTNFYLIPYFDMGVKLNADGQGGIAGIAGSVHYLQPGLSSLLTRRVYNEQRLFEEGLLREDPEEFEKRRILGYVRNANVDRPAVISINMLISSMAVTEFLNRIHPFRDDQSENYARIMIDYAANCILNDAEFAFEADSIAAKYTGRGDCEPFLRMPEFSKK